MTVPSHLVTGAVTAGMAAAGVLVGAVEVGDAPLVLLGSAVMLAGAGARRSVAGLATGAAAGALTVAARAAALPTTTVWDAVALAVVVVLAAVAAWAARVPTTATLTGAAVAFLAVGPAAPLTGVDTARLLPAFVAVAWGAAAAAVGLVAAGGLDRFAGASRARAAQREPAS